MAIKYSASTLGFFDTRLFSAAKLPNDAKDVPDDLYAAICDKPKDKIVVPGADGLPMLADPTPPTLEELASKMRARRDALLVASDWVVLRSLETGTAIPAEWSAYRQSLREVPQQAGFPQSIDWPVPPA